MAGTTRDEALNQAISLINSIMASPPVLSTLVNSPTPAPAVFTGNVTTEQEVNSLFRRGTSYNPAASVANVASVNLNVARETPPNMRYETRRTFGNWATSTKKKRYFFLFL